MWGKREIAGYEQFLIFPQCFQLNKMIVSSFVRSFDTTSLFAAELEEPKISILGKGLVSEGVIIQLNVYAITTKSKKDINTLTQLNVHTITTKSKKDINTLIQLNVNTITTV